jgi:hypothetical protein
MLEELQRVKPAVDNMAVDERSYILVKDGKMYATDSRMTVEVETSVQGEFVAHCKTLSDVLAVMNPESIKVNPKTITLKDGALRAQLATLPIETIAPITPGEGHDIDVTTDLCDALSMAKAFMSDDMRRPWACGVRFFNGKLYATNNISIIRVDVLGMDDTVADFILPFWFVDYITKRVQAPRSIRVEDDALTAFYTDGWVRTIRVDEEMPDVIMTLADGADASFELTREWKALFFKTLTLSKLSDSVIIAGDSIRSGSDVATLEAAVKSMTEKDTLWHPQFVSPVITVASHFDVANYPDAAPFIVQHGPHVIARGVVLGKV